MSGKKSRNKGARGEREFAEVLRGYGFEGERSARNGKTDEDVQHNIDGVHFEVKRVERLTIDKWVQQAERDANQGETPIVVYRKNGDKWRAVIPVDDLLVLLGGEKIG